MKNLFRIAIFSVIAAIIGGAAACQSAPPTPTAEEATILAWADPITETTMQGLSEGNLAKYTQYGTAAFKAAVTRDVLDKSYAQVTNQLGAYQSKTFLRIETQPSYIIVHYRAKYARGEVGVRMVFDKDHLVAGQWFE